MKWKYVSRYLSSPLITEGAHGRRTGEAPGLWFSSSPLTLSIGQAPPGMKEPSGDLRSSWPAAHGWRVLTAAQTAWNQIVWVSWVLACVSSSSVQRRPVSAAHGARGRCCSLNSRHQDRSNSSRGANGSADQLLTGYKDILNSSLGINSPRCLNSSVLLLHSILLDTLVS